MEGLKMSNATESLFRVFEIIVHKMSKMCHLDEVFAICILWMFGEGKFPGIQEAAIVEFRKDIHGGEWLEQLRQYGRLRVGCGGLGDPLDEHTRTGRDEKECATTLVIKFIGLVGQNERLDTLVQKIFFSDKEGAPHTWHAEQVIKRLGAIFNVEEVVTWMKRYIYSALATNEKGCGGPARNFDRIAAQVVAEREGIRVAKAQDGRSTFVATVYAAGFGNHELYSEIIRLARQCTENRPAHPLHVAAMVETLHASGKIAADTLKKWVAMWLEAELAAQQQFLDAKAFIAEGGAQIITIRNQKSGKPLVLCVGETDNPAFGRAARQPKQYGGPVEAALVLQVRSGDGGYFFISSNNQVISKESMDDLIKAIRVMEEQFAAEEDQRDVAYFDDEVVKRDGFVDDRWYFQKGAGLIFNGSLTNDSVQKARLEEVHVRELCETFLSEVKLPEKTEQARRREFAQSRRS